MCDDCGISCSSLYLPERRKLCKSQNLSDTDDEKTNESIRLDDAPNWTSAEKDNSDLFDLKKLLRRGLCRQVSHMFTNDAEEEPDLNVELQDDCASDFLSEEFDEEEIIDAPIAADNCNENNYHENGRTLLKCCVYFLCMLQSSYLLPDAVIRTILVFLQGFCSVMFDKCAILTSLIATLPTSVYMLWQAVAFKQRDYVRYVVCKNAALLHNYNDCIQIVNGKKLSKTCTTIEYLHHSQVGRRKPCGELLLKSVTLTDGSQKLYAFKTYCCKSLIETTKGFLWQTRLSRDPRALARSSLYCKYMS